MAKSQRAILEKSAERKIKMRATELGGLAIKLYSQFFTGLPDRLILLPEGRVMFAEIKSTIGGVLSARQSVVHRLLRKLGFRVYLIEDRDTLEQLLKDMELC